MLIVLLTTLLMINIIETAAVAETKHAALFMQVDDVVCVVAGATLVEHHGT